MTQGHDVSILAFETGQLGC